MSSRRGTTSFTCATSLPNFCDNARKVWKVQGRALIVQHERHKQFFAGMHGMGMIPTNPVKNLKPPRVVIEPVIAFDRDQQAPLIEALKDNPRLPAANLVMKYTGLAPVDLVHLEPQKLRGEYITTRRQKTCKNQGGKGRLLKIKIPERLITMLRDLEPYSSRLWFWNKQGDQVRYETAAGNLRRQMRPSSPSRKCDCKMRMVRLYRANGKGRNWTFDDAELVRLAAQTGR